MNMPQFKDLEVGDRVSGFGWRGRPITGIVVGFNRRESRATVRGGGSMATVHYKKLTLIERDPSSRLAPALAEFLPHLTKFMPQLTKFVKLIGGSGDE